MGLQFVECSIVEIIFREVVIKLKMQLQQRERERERERTINKLHNKSTIKSKYCEVENIMID